MKVPLAIWGPNRNKSAKDTKDPNTTTFSEVR